MCTEARAHLQATVEGLAAKDLGIGGALEFRQTVEAFWSWPFRQPIEIAIGSSNVAVSARRDVDDKSFASASSLNPNGLSSLHMLGVLLNNHNP
jgi:hypothetical protein